MIRHKVYATAECLKEISGNQIMYLLSQYGSSYFSRRNMMIIQGMHMIIIDPKEMDEDVKLSLKVFIGEFWL